MLEVRLTGWEVNQEEASRILAQFYFLIRCWIHSRFGESCWALHFWLVHFSIFILCFNKKFTLKNKEHRGSLSASSYPDTFLCSLSLYPDSLHWELCQCRKFSHLPSICIQKSILGFDLLTVFKKDGKQCKHTSMLSMMGLCRDNPSHTLLPK